VSNPARVDRGNPGARYYRGKYGGHGFPRGPIGNLHRTPTCAIGFCPRCGSNARQTTAVGSLFDCPTCTFFWYDDRTGLADQDRDQSFDDYFSPMEADDV